MSDGPEWDGEVGVASEIPSTEKRAPPQEILELDHVYDALGHPRRRYLCYTLLADTRLTLTDLARKIAAWENDIPVHDVTDDQCERVYISPNSRRRPHPQRAQGFRWSIGSTSE